MRIVLAVSVIWLLLGSLLTECSQIDVKDEQSWYEDSQKTDKHQNRPQQQIEFHISENNNPNYQKLLSVKRQILMSEQMIQLYQQRLALLKDLKAELKRKITLRKIEPAKSESSTNNGPQNNPKRSDNFDSQLQNQPIQSQRHSQSTQYVFLNNFQVDVSVQKERQLSSENLSLNDQIVLVPPFVINKAQSYVSVINTQRNIGKTTKYSYGETSNRLLFYTVEKSQQNEEMHAQSDQFKGSKFMLNLMLQIKPNKIKSVKISYHQGLISNNSALNKDFEVQQVITSYQSNGLISQDFMWHKALQFENQIIGFVNQKVYIKGKDKKMNEVDVGSRVLSLYSLNQYKLFYIAEDKVGTINVRSLMKSDQIRFEYYLGNKTLIKQKELQKKSSQENGNVQDDYAQDSFELGTYWHSPFAKQFSTLKAISVYNVQSTKQVLILLSNGELLLHSNQKIIASTNLGTQLMKMLKFDHILKEPSPMTLEKVQIKMELLPSFKHILISSSLHKKLIIFNVTIPYLTQISKSSSFFSSSTKSNQLTSHFWKAFQISNQDRNPTKRSGLDSYDNQIYLFVNSPLFKQIVPQATKISNDYDQKVVYFYHCQYTQKDSDNYILVSQYRLLLNLFDQNGLSIANSQSSEGRSFWWNLLLILIIAFGVFLIRKCKQQSPQATHQWQDPASQKFSKTKNSSRSLNNLLQSKNISKMTKEPERNDKRLTTTKTKIEYDNMVISELQNYLEKQGQKLSKEQIAFMVRQMEENQPKQANRKNNLKREYKNEENQPEDIIIDEKPKKKVNLQEKNKHEHLPKKKRQ